jgi:CHAT domain-containing protein
MTSPMLALPYPRSAHRLSGHARAVLTSARELTFEPEQLSVLMRRGTLLRRVLRLASVDPSDLAQALAAERSVERVSLASTLECAGRRVALDEIDCITTVHLFAGAADTSPVLGGLLAEHGASPAVLLKQLERLRKAATMLGTTTLSSYYNDPVNSLPGEHVKWFALNALDAAECERTLLQLPQPITTGALLVQQCRQRLWAWEDLLTVHGRLPQELDELAGTGEPGAIGVTFDVEPIGPVMRFGEPSSSALTVSEPAARALWMGLAVTARAGRVVGVLETVACACTAVRASSVAAFLHRDGVPLPNPMTEAVARTHGTIFSGMRDVAALAPEVLGGSPLTEQPAMTDEEEFDPHVLRELYRHAAQQVFREPNDLLPHPGEGNSAYRFGGIRQMRLVAAEAERQSKHVPASNGSLSADSEYAVRITAAASLLSGDTRRLARAQLRLGEHALRRFRRKVAEECLTAAEQLALAEGDLELATSARSRRARVLATFDSYTAGRALDPQLQPLFDEDDAARAAKELELATSFEALKPILETWPWLLSADAEPLRARVLAKLEHDSPYPDLDLAAVSRGKLLAGFLKSLRTIDGGLAEVHSDMSARLSNETLPSIELSDAMHDEMRTELAELRSDPTSEEKLMRVAVMAGTAAELAADADRGSRLMLLAQILRGIYGLDGDEKSRREGERVLMSAIRFMAPGCEMQVDAFEGLADLHMFAYVRSRRQSEATALTQALWDGLVWTSGPGIGTARLTARLARSAINGDESRPHAASWLLEVASFGYGRLWTEPLPTEVAELREQMQKSSESTAPDPVRELVNRGLKTEDPDIALAALNALPTLDSPEWAPDVLRAQLLARHARLVGLAADAEPFAQALTLVRSAMEDMMKGGQLPLLLVTARAWIDVARQMEDPMTLREVDSEVTPFLHGVFGAREDDAGRLAAARSAGEFARSLAAAYVEMNCPADAVAAIEASRALLLNHYLNSGRVARQDEPAQTPQPEDDQESPDGLSLGLRAATALRDRPGPLKPLDGPRKMLSWKTEVQSALVSVTKEAPLVYLSSEADLGSAYVARSPDDVSIVRLPAMSRERLMQLVLRLKEAEHTPRFSEALDSVGAELWSGVVEPLLKEGLDKVSSVRCIPMDFFQLLPLQAAWRPASDQPDGRLYTGDQWRLSFAPSARVLAHCIDRAAPLQPRRVVAVAPDNTGMAELPFAYQEVQAIQQALPGTEPLNGPAANPERLYRELERGHDIFHFAGHCFSRLHGESQFLILSKGDAILAHNVFRQVVPGRLVVLSACESAAQSLEHLNEAMSFAAAFLAAGYPGAIATSWKVSDFSSAILMAKFYRLLAEGPATGDIAATLWEAQRWLRHATLSVIFGEFPWTSFHVYADASTATLPPFADSFHWSSAAFYGA